MFFNGYYFITVEKETPSENYYNIDPFPVFIFLVDWLLFHTIFNWVTNNIHKCFTRFWFFLKSNAIFGKSKVLDEKNSNFESTHQKICVSDKDETKLSRENLKLLMGELGLFGSQESEELEEFYGPNEFSGLFDETEPSLEEMKEAFDVYDLNRDGFIDAMELQRVLFILGLREGSELHECKEMIGKFDENNDGKIGFNEFVKFMERAMC